MLKLILKISVVALLTGCAFSVHQHYVSSMDQNARYGVGKWVKAEADQSVVLGFALDSNYVEEGMKRLEAQCPGRLVQVTTEHLTAYKFLSYEQKVILQGLCV